MEGCQAYVRLPLPNMEQRARPGSGSIEREAAMVGMRDRIRALSQDRLVSVDDQVQVAGTQRITPGYQRVTLTGACLGAYRTVLPADGFKIDLARRDDPDPRWRGFTVRRFDASRLTIDVDVVLHPGGRASTWAQQAAVGDRLGFLGFRRDFAIGDGISRHLLVADASGLPAVCAILESLPADHHVDLVAESGFEADRVLLEPALHRSASGDGPSLDLSWRSGAPSIGPASPLVAMARATRVAEGTQVWLAAESSTARAIRAWLRESAGVPRHDTHLQAYWIAGLDSTQRDRREVALFEQAAAAGVDVSDPDFYDRVTFEDAVPGRV